MPTALCNRCGRQALANLPACRSCGAPAFASPGQIAPPARDPDPSSCRSAITTGGALLLLVLAAGACRRPPLPPEPVIVGRVLDNFSRPIQGATTSIRDTAFRVQTDARGTFSLPFTPGAFHLVVEAPGCVRWERDLQIAVPARHPLGDRVLLRLPETAPSLAVVAAVGGYRPLPPVTLERRVVTPAGGGFYNRCAEFHLTAPIAALRGSFLSLFLPNRNVGLVALQGTLVTSDAFPTTATSCPGAPRLVPVRRRDMGERQLVAFDDLAAGTYCFIPLPRMPPQQQAMQEAHCFRWERVVGQGGNPVMTDPPPENEPLGQTEADDHSPNAGGSPVNCPLRNGVIPCTEECYRADARWPDPGSPQEFFASERESGECYVP